MSFWKKKKKKKTKLTSSTTTEGHVTPNKKSTKTTETTFPTESKNQRKKGYIPKVCENETSNELI